MKWTGTAAPRPPGPGAKAVMVECLALLRAQRLVTIVTALVVAVSAVAVLVTAGNAAALEADVLARIDAQAPRTIVIRATGSRAGLTTDLVQSLSRLSNVEEVLGFGPVTDATAAALPMGTRVGIRAAYGRFGGVVLRTGEVRGLGRDIIASPGAIRAFGIQALPAQVATVSGQPYLVIERRTVPEFLQRFEPLAIIPTTLPEASAPLSVVVILARTAQDVEGCTQILASLLVDSDRDQVSLESPKELAQLRAALAGELRTGSRSLVLGAILASALLSALTTLAYTLSRRKDFGRRRALGASRPVIVALVTGHTLLAATMGAVVGSAAGALWLYIRQGHLPTFAFFAAVGVALVAVATFASGIPALLAARRDPVRELRVP